MGVEDLMERLTDERFEIVAWTAGLILVIAAAVALALWFP